jgi:2-oxoglutarate dehydrogenase E2 component (dihydrolipoamide succinyltransferase)
VLNIARTEGISMAELETIPGTGEGGRVSKKDLLAYVAGRKGKPAASAPAKAATPIGLASEVIPMSNVQQRMAQHMVHSIQTSPHVAAVHEVDMTEVARHREGHATEFERAEGFKLTYMPYIVDAVVRAIKKFPLINSSIDGTTIVRKAAINIGIAVASESGLIVPVIKHAEEKNFVGLARTINDLALRTRAKKLTPEDIQGGTFTISNFGVFGTMIGTPIINQPQVAILDVGAVEKRPKVMSLADGTDVIAVRLLAMLGLAFDHRVVDGADADRFMADVKKELEAFPEGAL